MQDHDLRTASGDATQPEDKPWATVEEVAAKLGVSPRWLAEQCRDGVIEHVHMARKRRFTPAQVTKLLEQHTVQPVAKKKRDLARDRVIRDLRQRRS
jgi:excisionase family DNA binding protein